MDIKGSLPFIPTDFTFAVRVKLSLKVYAHYEVLLDCCSAARPID